MFRALLSHHQEARHMQHWVYCVRVYVCCLCSVSWCWASNARNMQKPLIHNKFNTKSATRWFYYTDILWRTINKTLIPFGFHGLIKQRATKSYEGMEAQLRALTPTKERCVVSFKAGLDVLEERKISCPWRKSNHDLSSVQPVLSFSAY
jgi:hypothetical protein